MSEPKTARRRRSTRTNYKRPSNRRALGAESLEPRRLLTTVTGASPTANVHTAAISSDVSATFSQSIDPATVTAESFAVHSSHRGQLVGAGATVSTAGHVVTLNPAFDFFPGEQVQVTASSDIRSTAADPVKPEVWQFRAEVTSGGGIFASNGQSLGDHRSRAAALGDLDGDGDLDAFVSNLGQGDRVWLNDSGQFTDSTQSLGDHASNFVALGDLDGDGDLDAFVGNTSYEGSRIWINDGSAQFSDSGQILGDHTASTLTLGDLDGDGDLDAFVASNFEGNRIWRNDGSGGFTDSGQSPGNSTDLSLGDLDGDGDLDAVLVGYGANQVWQNDGSGQFSDTGQSMGDHGTRAVSLGDLDGDGDLDAFMANVEDSFGGASNRVWKNDGNGVFAESGQNLGNHFSLDVSLSDLDGDGDLDAFVGNYDEGDRVWINSGSGTFSAAAQSIGDHDSQEVSLGDLDGDGDVDAFVTVDGHGSPNHVWLNQDSNPLADLVATDEFESGSFLGGSGDWIGEWNVSGDVVISTNGPLGSYEARLRRATGDLIRAVDTSGLSVARLSFAARLNNFEADDKAWVKTSADGLNWTTVMQFSDGQDDDQYQPYQIDIIDPPETLYIRFDAGMSNHRDYWYIDDVKISGTPDVPASQPPVITSAPILTATQNAPYTYDVDASDPDVGDTLTYSLELAPAGMVINVASGVIAWTPNNDDVGTNPVTVRVQDQTGASATQSFNILVGNVNDAPTIVSLPATTATVDAAYTYDVEATDPDVGDSLAYSLSVAPPDMTIDESTGLIHWAPTAAGTYPVTVVVEDASSTSDSQSFSIVVSEAPSVSTYTQDEAPGLLIPDRGEALSTLAITDSFVIAGLTLSVDISHPRPSDLRVSLTHGTTTVELTNISGGNLAEFNGADVSGEWKLEVHDVRKKKTGVLNSWEVTVERSAPAASSSSYGFADVTQVSSVDATTRPSDEGSDDTTQAHSATPLAPDNTSFATAVDAVIVGSMEDESDDKELSPSLEKTIAELLSEF